MGHRRGALGTTALATLVASLAAGLALGTPASAAAQDGAPGRKSPALALALSLVVPGAGQVYNGHYGKGAVMFGSAALTASSIVLTIADALELDDDRSGTGVHLLGATGIGIVVWSWIDAPLSARAINRGLETGSVTIGIAPRVRIDAAGRVDLDLARVAF